MAWRDWGGRQGSCQGWHPRHQAWEDRAIVATELLATQEEQLLAEFHAAEAEGDPQQVALGRAKLHRTQATQEEQEARVGHVGFAPCLLSVSVPPSTSPQKPQSGQRNVKTMGINPSRPPWVRLRLRR